MDSHEPLTPELRAAEYVLGTLDATERAQVESDLPRDRDLAREVAYWEQRLGPLSLLQAPVEPPPDVWSQVSARTQPVVNDEPRRLSSGLWIGFAVAASMAAFALAALMFVGLQPEPATNQASPPVYASLIEDQERNLSWLVTADSSPAQALQIVAMGDSYGKTWTDRSLELWLLAPGENPVSLGLLPKEGVSTIPVSADVASKLAQSNQSPEATKLAVSDEPLGGSPTGAPTGEVLYVVAVNQRKG